MESSQKLPTDYSKRQLNSKGLEAIPFLSLSYKYIVKRSMTYSTHRPSIIKLFWWTPLKLKDWGSDGIKMNSLQFRIYFYSNAKMKHSFYDIFKQDLKIALMLLINLIYSPPEVTPFSPFASKALISIIPPIFAQAASNSLTSLDLRDCRWQAPKENWLRRVLILINPCLPLDKSSIFSHKMLIQS